MAAARQQPYSLALWPLPAPGSCPVCRACGVTHASRYPDRDEGCMFSETIVLWCCACGSGYVAGADKVIEGYYCAEYAASNRRDRAVAPEIYFSESHRRSSRKVGRYFARAGRHLSVLEQLGADLDTILDFGSGPGYLLYMADARRKYAVEPDVESWKYLDYIGAERVSIEEMAPGSCGAIVCSHSLEHLTETSLGSVVAQLREILRLGGHLLVEVPHGGFSYMCVAVKQAPHTLFFTPEGLCRAVTADGCKLVHKSAHSNPDAPTHPRPIYVPDADEFHRTRRGALVVVIRRDS